MNIETVIKRINKLVVPEEYDRKRFRLQNLSIELTIYKMFLGYHHLNTELTDLLSEFDDDSIVNSAVKFFDKRYATPELFREHFQSIYPKFAVINNRTYPLFTGDIDKLCEDYAKKIGYSIEKHKEIVELLEYGKANNLINIGFEKFILSYYWETLKEIRNTTNQGDKIIIADDF